MIKAAAELALKYLDDQDAVESSLAVEALRVTAIHGNDSIAQKYLDAYESSDDVNFKTKLMRTMYFTDPVSIERILAFSQSDQVNAGDRLRHWADS